MQIETLRCPDGGLEHSCAYFIVFWRSLPDHSFLGFYFSQCIILLQIDVFSLFIYLFIYSYLSIYLFFFSF